MPEIVLLDTNAIIFLAVGARIAPDADRMIRDAARAGTLNVSPVSAWEIGNIARPSNSRRVIDFLPDPASWFSTFMRTHSAKLCPLTATAAIASAFLPEGLNSDPADKLLTATSREIGGVFVTRDRDILAYAALGHVHAIAC